MESGSDRGGWLLRRKKEAEFQAIIPRLQLIVTETRRLASRLGDNGCERRKRVVGGEPCSQRLNREKKWNSSYGSDH